MCMGMGCASEVCSQEQSHILFILFLHIVWHMLYCIQPMVATRIKEMEHDKIAEALADIRVIESTQPKAAQQRNDGVDEAIIAVRDALGLRGIAGQCFCARAQYGRICTSFKN